MNSEYTLYVLLAGIAFAGALLAVVMQWLQADDVAARVEAGLRDSRTHRAAATEVVRVMPPPRVTEPRKPVAERAAMPNAEVVSKPTPIAEDETALARLCLGWGAGGTVVGAAAGAAIAGFVGALLGAVILSAATIGVVVVAVLFVDHARLAAWREASETK